MRREYIQYTIPSNTFPEYVVYIVYSEEKMFDEQVNYYVLTEKPIRYRRPSPDYKNPLVLRFSSLTPMGKRFIYGNFSTAILAELSTIESIIDEHMWMPV